MPEPISTIDQKLAAGGAWTIAYAQFPIGRRELGFGFATHGMLVVRDDRSSIVAVYEGLAHGLRRDGSYGAKAIGTAPRDTILFCRDGPGVDYRFGQRNPAEDQTLLSGPQSEIARRMRIAEEIGHRINAKQIGYPPFGIFGFASRNPDRANANSNAVIATLVAAMGLTSPRPSRFCPGRRVMLLEASEIAAVQRQDEGQGRKGRRISLLADANPGMDLR